MQEEDLHDPEIPAALRHTRKIILGKPVQVQTGLKNQGKRRIQSGRSRQYLEIQDSRTAG
jgi:hypothetical protein